MLPKIQHIKGSSNWLSVLLDIGMLMLTVGDLVWLMFDALYTNTTIKTLADSILPFNYEQIHQDFFFYDGIIVSIFLVELLGRWAVAIYKKQYPKWFFYPFAHWYDVLGCFPTSSFRILRLLRIIGLTYRLHQWGVIDLNNYAVIKTILLYYNIAIEEVSDRVVIKVLAGAKDEIERGQPFSDAIIQNVLKPKQSELAEMICRILQDGLRDKYPQYRTILQEHISKTVQETVTNNDEVKQIGRIPLVGKQLKNALNSATSEIVFGVLDRLLQDASDEKNREMISLIVDSIMEVLLEHEALQNSKLGNEIILESIDLIVKRVEVKQWKLLD